MPLPRACLANDYDNSAIGKGFRPPLPEPWNWIRYAEFLIDRPPSDKVAIAALRGGVIEVYGDAAEPKIPS